MITPTETILRNQTERDTRTCSRWWWVLFVVISVVAIFLIVFFTTDLKYILFSKPVSTPPDIWQNVVKWNANRQHILGNYAEPGVIVFLMGNNTDEPLCYSAGSALLSGFPVVVAGYEMPFNGFLSKFDYMERAIENAGLKPDDVILVTDSDTLFMGTEIYLFLYNFCTKSAKTPVELDALEVRQGYAMSPFLVSSEVSCNASDVFNTTENCALGYEAAYKKIRKYATAHPGYRLKQVYDDLPLHYINSGVVIARVWAYKEFLQKARNLTSTQNSSADPSKGWTDEQSVYTALYLDLIKWEVEHDVFSMPWNVRQTARSPYGVPGGLIDLDYGTVFPVVSSPTQLSKFEMSDKKWQTYLQSSGSEHPHTQNITDILNVSQFVSRLYKRAYEVHGEDIYAREPVPMFIMVRGASRADNITYTPPIFTMSITPRGSKDSLLTIYPPIFHSSGRIEGFTKRSYMEVVSVSARWFVPMVYNKTAKDKAVQYLESKPLFLSTNDSVLQYSYHAKCGFPYERVIKEVEDNTGSSVFSGSQNLG